MMDTNFQPGIKIMIYSPLAGFHIFSQGWEKAKQEAYDLTRYGGCYDENPPQVCICIGSTNE